MDLYIKTPQLDVAMDQFAREILHEAQSADSKDNVRVLSLETMCAATAFDVDDFGDCAATARAMMSPPSRRWNLPACEQYRRVANACATEIKAATSRRQSTRLSLLLRRQEPTKFVFVDVVYALHFGGTDDPVSKYATFGDDDDASSYDDAIYFDEADADFALAVASSQESSSSPVPVDAKKKKKKKVVAVAKTTKDCVPNAEQRAYILLGMGDVSGAAACLGETIGEGPLRRLRQDASGLADVARVLGGLSISGRDRSQKDWDPAFQDAVTQWRRNLINYLRDTNDVDVLFLGPSLRRDLAGMLEPPSESFHQAEKFARAKLQAIVDHVAARYPRADDDGPPAMIPVLIDPDSKALRGPRRDEVVCAMDDAGRQDRLDTWLLSDSGDCHLKRSDAFGEKLDAIADALLVCERSADFRRILGLKSGQPSRHRRPSVEALMSKNSIDDTPTLDGDDNNSEEEEDDGVFHHKEVWGTLEEVAAREDEARATELVDVPPSEKPQRLKTLSSGVVVVDRTSTHQVPAVKTTTKDVGTFLALADAATNPRPGAFAVARRILRKRQQTPSDAHDRLDNVVKAGAPKALAEFLWASRVDDDKNDNKKRTVRLMGLLVEAYRSAAQPQEDCPQRWLPTPVPYSDDGEVDEKQKNWLRLRDEKIRLEDRFGVTDAIVRALTTKRDRQQRRLKDLQKTWTTLEKRRCAAKAIQALEIQVQESDQKISEATAIPGAEIKFEFLSFVGLQFYFLTVCVVRSKVVIILAETKNF